ncbi:MAG: hypothetical protein CENE_00898 [Candidatus Celerinatantimonas neptuna]|nr:MAG: hypothetical protein CENE_00898 [Candidatus Celerinatantimonas neptuna]
MKKVLPVVIITAFLLQGCAAGVVAVGAGIAADTARDNRTIGTQIDDKTLDIRITQTLGDHKKLWNESNLSIIVQEGQALIVGQTPTPEQRNEIVNIAKHVSGVKKVFNEIRLAEPSSLSTRARDSWITTKIKAQIYTNKKILPGKIQVITENSEVFLIGVVTKSEADTAIDIARHTSGVSRVIKFFKIISKTPSSL